MWMWMWIWTWALLLVLVEGTVSTAAAANNRGIGQTFLILLGHVRHRSTGWLQMDGTLRMAFGDPCRNRIVGRMRAWQLGSGNQFRRDRRAALVGFAVLSLFAW